MWCSFLHLLPCLASLWGVSLSNKSFRLGTGEKLGPETVFYSTRLWCFQYASASYKASCQPSWLWLPSMCLRIMVMPAWNTTVQPCSPFLLCILWGSLWYNPLLFLLGLSINLPIKNTQLPSMGFNAAKVLRDSLGCGFWVLGAESPGSALSLTPCCMMVQEESRLSTLSQILVMQPDVHSVSLWSVGKIIRNNKWWVSTLTLLEFGEGSWRRGFVYVCTWILGSCSTDEC